MLHVICTRSWSFFCLVTLITNLALLSQHCIVLSAHVLVKVGPEGGDVLAVLTLVILDLKLVEKW